MGEVVLRHLTKRFGNVVAVNDVSLRVEDGEFLVLLGPSGCGKSTILRLIAGLEDATSGEIAIGDRLVNFVDPVKRNVAMVFQNYALYPHMTVFKNVAFPLQMAKQSKEDIRESVKRAATILELDELLDRYPDQLSGGQRQRVALARAIVREPDAFLMDEPLSNLDALLRVQTRGELTRLHQRLGTTTIYVTHDQVEAMTMGHRIAVMQHGVIQQLAVPEEVYSRPTNVFVATFIGSPPMNLIPGSVARHNGGWGFSGEGFFVDLDPRAAGVDSAVFERAAGASANLGIRPEDVRVLPAGEGALPGTVQLVEPVGSDLFLTIEAAGTALQVRTPPETPVSQGDNVGLSFTPHRSHVFDEHGRNVRYAPEDVYEAEPALEAVEEAEQRSAAEES
jgi:multiple sugar transport system ATP-binding protein